jgi:formate hydrogenlyase subunit 6/NADH:ubiquinone oxidoreductase subunit I
MLSYFRDIGLGTVTVLNSMWVALLHLFTRSVTLQYPTEKWEMPERSRARLLNNIQDCIGCSQCVRVCPTDCIKIKTEKRGKDEPERFAADGTAIKLRTYVYDIDMTLCCYCGLCTFACPTHCLVMTPAYEYAAYDKRDHVYHFAVETPLNPQPSQEHPTLKA